MLGEYDDWASVEAVQKLGQVLENLPMPAVLHCNRGYTITFVTLMYMANRTRNDPNYSPRLTVRLFIK